MWSHYFMADRRGKVEAVRDFIFLASKITADGDSSQDLRHLLFGRKSMTNLDSILKIRDINLPTKVDIFKPRIFPEYVRCENWTKEKVEH